VQRVKREMAEPHAAIMIPASMYGFIVTPHVHATAGTIIEPNPALTGGGSVGYNERVEQGY
jgi:hypothetical protein